MSAVVRQSNLFAGEDFRKVYKTFQDIDFRAYDFDTIKQALIEYIRAHYPEDFNDYIESSEFVAIIELLAYLGTSLSFRVDLNSRENIMDTAERRESIIRLARLINYQPKRNLAANGLFKLQAVETDQALTDAGGIDLNNTPIFWNDPNNLDWFDQFIQVLNASFNTTNPFGRPSKSGSIGSIPTDLYQMNNVLGLDVAYNITISVNGEGIPVDIVNPDFEEGFTFFERKPDQNQAFNMIYRNDSLGVQSDNTGFFLYFRQGELQKVDQRYDFPLPNRVVDIDIENVNQTDVYVQEINDLGEVLEQWQQVPTLNGQNVIFNSLRFDIRKIFEVISGLNDTVDIKYADGNFGDIPTGVFRTWVRPSINRNLTIRPEDVQNLVITLPYIGIDGLEYNLKLTFSLEQTIDNSAPAETNEQVKIRAPQVFYTQDRMVNKEDYNVYPLIFANTINKLRATNRTFAGHSRFIDLNDPTGFHRDLLVFGQDGALYKDNEEFREVVRLTTNMVGDVADFVYPRLQETLFNTNLQTFFYNDYLAQVDPEEFVLPDDTNWKTSPDRFENETGYFIDETGEVIILNTVDYKFVKQGSILKFDEPNSNNTITVSVKSIINAGEPIDDTVTDIGPIELSTEVQDGWQATTVLPAFRTILNSDERDDVREELDNLSSFGLGYNLDNDVWYIIAEDVLLPNADFDITNGANSGNGASWLMTVTYFPGDTQTAPYFEFVTRGTVFVFESWRNVRFYWDPDQNVFDSNTGRALEDTIEIMSQINQDAEGDPLEESIIWKLSGVFIQEDGYQETAKIEVLPVDTNEDGVPDKPLSFERFVSPDDFVVFEDFVDDNGFERTRPWVTGWVDITSEDEPEVDTTDRTLAGYPLSEGGLWLIKNDSVLTSITNQLNEEFNATGEDAIDRINAAKEYVNILESKSFRSEEGYNVPSDERYHIITASTDATGTEEAISEQDESHFEKNGKVFTQDTNTEISNAQPLYFKWSHFAPTDQRVDPSPSNIVDAIILTEAYLDDVNVWKEEGGSRAEFPLAPTTEELRVQFGELDNFKMLSDQVIFNSGKFKILFGEQAEAELQAVFKVVKIATVAISDNEIKTRVIQAIDEYFDVDNWDFGERFFYTELAAFIHKKLSKEISSVVIVPQKEESEFGDLFEIPANSDELFISTATVSEVEIVKNYTDSNLRK